MARNYSFKWDNRIDKIANDFAILTPIVFGDSIMLVAELMHLLHLGYKPGQIMAALREDNIPPKE